MLASALATCTFSVLHSWATHAKIPVDDLALDVRWSFADDPHRVSRPGRASSTGHRCPANRLDGGEARRRDVHRARDAAAPAAHHHRRVERAGGARSARIVATAASAARHRVMTVPVVRFTVAGQETASQGLGRAYTVVFDGDCKVCTRLVEGAAQLGSRATARDRALAAAGRDGALSRGSRRAPTSKRCSSSPPTARPGRAPPRSSSSSTCCRAAASSPGCSRSRSSASLADRFYRWFARNRYRLGCGAHCQSRPLDVMWAEAERDG